MNYSFSSIAIESLKPFSIQYFSLKQNIVTNVNKKFLNIDIFEYAQKRLQSIKKVSNFMKKKYVLLTSFIKKANLSLKEEISKKYNSTKSFISKMCKNNFNH